MSEDRSATRCPLCRGEFEGVCWGFDSPRPTNGYDCETCGRFEVSREALDDELERDRVGEIPRAILAHKVRLAQRDGVLPMVKTDMVDAAKRERLPSPATQVLTLLRLVGDNISDTGHAFAPDETTGVTIGAPNRNAFYRLIMSAEEKGLITVVGTVRRQPRHGGSVDTRMFDLTFDGWDKYESEKRGQVVGSYGFIAMRFGDPILDNLVNNVVKPAVLSALGYDVVDLRDVARAGVIDNILRAQIRDAAFVVVDLTHDNSGAYWEAGYAEGLGKPVIYICEREKFDTAKTHFDTNHCTTVIWSEADTDSFAEGLVATIRRSLNLFPDVRTG
ncbi:MAG: hypothetical protein JWP49_2864 [Phenylobacterium sp.]|nr:hypothetical protein [Phenylobacterium sp.]